METAYYTILRLQIEGINKLGIRTCHLEKKMLINVWSHKYAKYAEDAL